MPAETTVPVIDVGDEAATGQVDRLIEITYSGKGGRTHCR